MNTMLPNQYFNPMQNQFAATNPVNPYAQNMNAVRPVNNGIIWVQGIEGAKAYQLSPNSNVMLLDSEVDGKFYIKTSDNIGMCNLRIFEYTEITDTPTATNNIDLSQYVTREELENILSNIGGINNVEQSVSSNKPSKSIKSTAAKQ